MGVPCIPGLSEFPKPRISVFQMLGLQIFLSQGFIFGIILGIGTGDLCMLDNLVKFEGKN